MVRTSFLRIIVGLIGTIWLITVPTTALHAYQGIEPPAPRVTAVVPPVQATETRANALSGNLAPGESHVFGLIPKETAGVIELNLAFGPQNDSELARRINLFVLRAEDLFLLGGSTRPADLAIAAGNRLFDGESNLRSASFQTTSTDEHLILVTNSSTDKTADYTLVASNGILVDDSGQTSSAHQTTKDDFNNEVTESIAATELISETLTSPVELREASGSLLYSVANLAGERWEVWNYDFSTDSTTQIADWRTDLELSSDGSQIAYFSWPKDAAGQSGIWVMDRNFDNNRKIISGGAYPSFSPDGNRLVINGGPDLYIVNSDGSELRRLTNGEYPDWNPVDDRIVYRACVKEPFCGLWLIDASSQSPDARQRLTFSNGDGQPAWSPDGEKIAYTTDQDGNFEIYLIDGDGNNAQRLTNSPASDGFPTWSPDGQWIAFRSDRSGSWAIHIMRPDGSDVHRVVHAPVMPQWFFEKIIWQGSGESSSAEIVRASPLEKEEVSLEDDETDRTEATSQEHQTQRIGRWIENFNLSVIPVEERPANLGGDLQFVVKDIFTTRNGSWEPTSSLGSIDPWAREYLKPFGAHNYFDDAGGDHHLFAAVMGLDGKLLLEQNIRYWIGGVESLDQLTDDEFIEQKTDSASGWTNLPLGPNANFSPASGQSGPWCWAPKGASEIVCGGGLPENLHISTFVIWQAVPAIELEEGTDLTKPEIEDVDVTSVTDAANNICDQVQVQEINLNASTTIYSGFYSSRDLSAPRAVAAVANGNRIIADSGNNRVVIVDQEGKEVKTFGSVCQLERSEGSSCIDPDGLGPLQLGDGQFGSGHDGEDGIWGIAVDTNGEIYVADTWNGRIQVFDSEGNFLRKWGSFGITNNLLGDHKLLFGPRGIAIDRKGNILVADTGNKRIVQFTPNGDFIKQVGGSGVDGGRFDEPVGIAVEPNSGSVFVSDTWNQRIQKLSPELEFETEYSVCGWNSKGRYHKPFVTVGPNGDVYASAPELARIYVYSSNGDLKSAFGQADNQVSELRIPTGIDIALHTNSLLVSDSGNNRVLEFPLSQLGAQVKSNDPDSDLSTVDAEAYGITVDSVSINPEEAYWKVTKIHHRTPGENRGSHAIYVDIIDESGNRIQDEDLQLEWGWEGQRSDDAAIPKRFDRPPNEPAAVINMFAGPRYWVKISGNGLPSEVVRGLHTNHADESGPNGEAWNSMGHHSFDIVFQQTKDQSKQTVLQLISPITNSNITQYFGDNPAFYRQVQYDGVPLQGYNMLDFGAPIGSAVMATDDGTVANVDFEPNGLGNFIILAHEWGESVYGNLDEVNVAVGVTIEKGEQIATSGNSGASTGPHLSFGIRITPYDRADGWGGFSDPLPYINVE